VVGHSQGGFTALAFAIERPARIQRLVLIGAPSGGPSFMKAPGAIWNRSHPDFWRFALLATLMLLLRNKATSTLMLNVIHRASYVDKSRAQSRPVQLRDWLRPAGQRTWWGSRVAWRLDYAPRLGEVSAPTLVLTGQHDPQVPPVCAEEIARGVPNAQLISFEQSGHYPFIEESERFWPVVDDFLAEPI